MYSDFAGGVGYGFGWVAGSLMFTLLHFETMINQCLRKFRLWESWIWVKYSTRCKFESSKRVFNSEKVELDIIYNFFSKL